MRKWAGAEPKSPARSSAIPAAVVAASPALTTRVLPPSGAASSPIVKAVTPPVLLSPWGSSASSAWLVGSGRPSGLAMRTGARTGADIKTEAAIAPAQSSSATRVTAAGRWAGVVEGNTASATPAALVAGSEPPTLVVLPVAKAGEPSPSEGWVAGASAAGPSVLGAGAAVGPAELESLLEPPLPPITAATMKEIASATGPAIPFSAPGTGWRRRRFFAGGVDLGFAAGASLSTIASGFAAAVGRVVGAAARSAAALGSGSGVAAGSPAAGTSALIGRSALTMANATWGRCPVHRALAGGRFS